MLEIGDVIFRKVENVDFGNYRISLIFFFNKFWKKLFCEDL